MIGSYFSNGTYIISDDRRYSVGYLKWDRLVKLNSQIRPDDLCGNWYDNTAANEIEDAMEHVFGIQKNGEKISTEMLRLPNWETLIHY